MVALAERDRQLAAARRRCAEVEGEVAELEREVALRQAQEAALKEAVRDLQREVERLQLPGKKGEMEYLKNVMLKLFETGEAGSLLPVVATVLRFSPAELGRCRAAVAARADHAAAAARGAGGEGGGSYLGSLASWATGAVTGR